jgi:hypothetical protein
MQADPVEEWRRLSALYSEMGDVEIHELADQINDLTPSAQDVLRDELKKRGLLEDQPAGHAFASLSPQHARDRRTVSHFAPASAEVDGSIEEVEEETPVEFSWKTLLCECAEMPEARAIVRVLMAAGIESWIERSGQYYGGDGGPKVVVAADQLEHARQFLEQPIPQDILEEERELLNAPQFELPSCPHCGAPDPILESVEPSNNWLCESCDHTWSDPIPSN